MKFFEYVYANGSVLRVYPSACKPFRGASPSLGKGNGKGIGVASPKGGDA